MERNIVTVYFNGDWKIIDGVWQFDGKQCKAVLMNPNTEFDELERIIRDRFRIDAMEYDIRFTHSNPMAPRLRPFDISSTGDLQTFFTIINSPRVEWNVPLCVSLTEKFTENLIVPEAGGSVPATTTGTGRVSQSDENYLDGASVHDLDRDDLNVPKSCDDFVVPNEERMAIEYAVQSQDSQPMVLNGLIKKGQTFKSKLEFKMAMSVHANADCFQFKVKKSTISYVVVVCIGEECKWRMRATKLKNSSLFYISKFNDKHNCALETRVAHQRHSYQLIAEKIKARYKSVEQMPSPKEMIDIMKKEYNITASYWKCWKAHEIAQNLMGGKPKDKCKETPNPDAQGIKDVAFESPRKRKRCARSSSTGELKKNQCSKCNKVGHNKKSCPVEPSSSKI